MKTFTKTLAYLSQIGYYHHPHTPGQLKRDRKEAKVLPIEQLFGLGLSVPQQKLNLPPDVLSELEIIKDQYHSPWCISSGLKGELVVHSHWPPAQHQGYVHLGPESFYVAEQMTSLSSPLKILDLGCAQGVLSSYAPEGSKVVGIDLDADAISIAKELHPEHTFYQHTIGERIDPVTETDFDLAVFNPPLAIPGETSMPHRDGGKQGLEIPLLFLNYAKQHLKHQGQAWFIAADPAVKGRFQILDKVKKDWEVLEYEVIESHFNHAYEQKHQYKDKHGVDFVNLVLVKLQKK